MISPKLLGKALVLPKAIVSPPEDNAIGTTAEICVANMVGLSRGVGGLEAPSRGLAAPLGSVPDSDFPPRSRHPKTWIRRFPARAQPFLDSR